MRLDYYNVTFRNVLIDRIREEVTSGGIYLPETKDQSFETYKVIRIGKNCEEVKPGDIITLTPGIRLAEKTLDGKSYYVVFEQQIDGYTRVTQEL